MIWGMSQDYQKERHKELRAVTERLNHHEREESGISIEEAEKIANTMFPLEKFSITDVFNLLVESISNLESASEDEVGARSLSTALCTSLNIIARMTTEHIGPYLILWGKYMNNSIRFSPLRIQPDDLPQDEFLILLDDSKKLAASKGFSDFEALREFHEHFYNGGWYYFPEEAQNYPQPIGSSGLGKYQLVTNHFLLSMPHFFTITEICELLDGEVNELRIELDSPDQVRLPGAFEAADVFIYLIHIASKNNLNISDLIKSAKRC